MGIQHSTLAVLDLIIAGMLGEGGIVILLTLIC
jgi:hypothetical protein